MGDNGHSDAPGAKRPSAVINHDFFGGLQASDAPNMAREIVRAGEKPEDVWCRSHLSQEQINAVANMMAKFDRFGMKEEKEDLKRWLALQRSKGGLAFDQLIQALTQTYNPNASSFKGNSSLWSRMVKRKQERQAQGTE